MAAGDRRTLQKLLIHLSCIPDPRAEWRVVYPLPEMLFLVICGTVAACDDYEEIVCWGLENVAHLRKVLPFYHGIPSATWLRRFVGRLETGLLVECFARWMADLIACGAFQWDRLIAIDGKTLHRPRKPGQACPHLVSAFSIREGLVLAQHFVGQKSAEAAAIPALIEALSAHMPLQGALISIDAAGCTPRIAQAIANTGADYVLAVKGNQPSLIRALKRLFGSGQAERSDGLTTLSKGHGRIEQRLCQAATLAHPDMQEKPFRRFRHLAKAVRTETRILGDRQAPDAEEHYYITSANALSARQIAEAVRGRWSIENRLHRSLNLLFQEAACRLRRAASIQNLAVLRHFAFNALTGHRTHASLRIRRKLAGWQPSLAHPLLAP